MGDVCINTFELHSPLEYLDIDMFGVQKMFRPCMYEQPLEVT